LIFENRVGFLKLAKKRRTRVKPNAHYALRAPLGCGARRRALNGELKMEKGEWSMMNGEW
jgi:hypothetical protein